MNDTMTMGVIYSLMLMNGNVLSMTKTYQVVENIYPDTLSNTPK